VSWGKLDGAFWADPRVTAGGNAGAGIYARVLSYGVQYGTVRVPAHVVDFIAGDDWCALGALAEVGLLRLDPDDWYTVAGALTAIAPTTPRRERARRAPGRATPAQIEARVEFYGRRCWICKVGPYAALDHVKPLSKGGSNWPANLRPACTPCNSRKGSRWPYEVPA